jgi:Leucine-rich repeat (LRR) protein
MNLKELNLSGNKIRKVENIGNVLVNLQTLMLSANKIEYLEDINEIS